jgi:alpha-ketoglutarate-dependent taurine dioxygenase
MFQTARSYLLTPKRRMPLVIESVGHHRSLTQLITESRPALEELLVTHGAILFRRFAVNELADFTAVTDAALTRRLNYVYRSTIRTEISDRIFTTTEYPAHQEILPHSENSFQLEWPMKVMFYCHTPAISGGETPLVDLLPVTSMINDRCLEKLTRLGVHYVRNYTDEMDIHWSTVFQTSSREAVAEYCERASLNLEWIGDFQLRTMQTCQGVATHPITSAVVLFNQAHLFHASSLGPDIFEALVDSYGIENLPRHAYYGDRTELLQNELNNIRCVFSKEAVKFTWKKGDVLLIDNMQVAHGRLPYKGARKMLAALGDPYSVVRSQ